MKVLKLALLAMVGLSSAAHADITFSFEAIVTSSPDPAIAVPGDTMSMEFTLMAGALNEHPDPFVAFNSSQVIAVSAYINGTRFPDLVFDDNSLAIAQQAAFDTINWIGGVPGFASVRAFMRFSPGTFPDFPAVEDILNEALPSLANASSLTICYTLTDCISAIPILTYTYEDGSAADADGDGVADLQDNCVAVSNADQTDTDADQIGNGCDPDIALPNDCQVNFADLIEIKQALFSTPADANWNADADLTGGPGGAPDGIVNFVDLQRAKDHFFGPPGPSASGCN